MAGMVKTQKQRWVSEAAGDHLLMSKHGWAQGMQDSCAPVMLRDTGPLAMNCHGGVQCVAEEVQGTP